MDENLHPLQDLSHSLKYSRGRAIMDLLGRKISKPATSLSPCNMYGAITIIILLKFEEQKGIPIEIFISLFIFFPVKAGKSPDPSTGKGRFSKKWTMYKSRMMNKFKKKYYAKTANLLTGIKTMKLRLRY